jgi:hypothetical protein
MCLRSGALFMFFHKSSPISCLACETFPAPVLRLGVITLKYFAVYCIYSPRGVEADSHSPSQNVPAFYLTRWFISVFIGARRRSRSWIESIQYTPTIFPQVPFKYCPPFMSGSVFGRCLRCGLETMALLAPCCAALSSSSFRFKFSSQHFVLRHTQSLWTVVILIGKQSSPIGGYQCFSETWITICSATRSYNPEEHSLFFHGFGDLASYHVSVFFP